MGDSVKIGRPNKYKPEYCEKLLEHMAKGLSFETFGATIDVSRATLYRWVEENKEFQYTKEKAFLKRQLFTEKNYIDMMTGDNEKGNSALTIFASKNIMGWKDKQEVSNEIKGGISLNIEYSIKEKDSKNIEDN